MSKNFRFLRRDIPGKRNSNRQSLKAWLVKLDSFGIARLES